MRLAAMQPYFFPHRHYFELIAESDIFVFMDSLPVSKRPWIKRNFFLLEGEVRRVSIPLQKHSYRDPINSLSIHPGFQPDSLVSRFDHSKDGQPSWNLLRNILKSSLALGAGQFSRGLTDSIVEFSSFLGLKTQFVKLSDLSIPSVPNRSERILAICDALNASSYLNNESGMDLYDRSAFVNSGVRLFSLDQEPDIEPSESRSLFDMAIDWSPEAAEVRFSEGAGYKIRDH